VPYSWKFALLPQLLEDALLEVGVLAQYARQFVIIGPEIESLPDSGQIRILGGHTGGSGAVGGEGGGAGDAVFGELEVAVLDFSEQHLLQGFVLDPDALLLPLARHCLDAAALG
jgi:hypothetical protein